MPFTNHHNIWVENFEPIISQKNYNKLQKKDKNKLWLTHMHICLQTCMHTCTHVLTHTHMHARTHTHTHTHTCTHTCTHTRTHACTHAGAHTHTHTHTHTHFSLSLSSAWKFLCWCKWPQHFWVRMVIKASSLLWTSSHPIIIIIQEQCTKYSQEHLLLTRFLPVEKVLYGVHRTHRDSSSFTWHQPCNNQTVLYVQHSPGCSKCARKSDSQVTVTHLESHATQVEWVCSRIENNTIYVL